MQITPTHDCTERRITAHSAGSCKRTRCGASLPPVAAGSPPCNLLDSMLIVRLLDIYSLIILAGVVLSWTGLPPDNPLVRIVRMLTEPVLGPIRRVLPTVGGIDFSPMVLLLLISFLRRFLPH
jgi:YggT family protein